MSKLSVNELLKILKILKEDKIKKKRKRKYKKKKYINNNLKSSSDHMIPTTNYIQSPNLNSEIQREQLKNYYQQQINSKNPIISDPPDYIDDLNLKIDNITQNANSFVNKINRRFKTLENINNINVPNIEMLNDDNIDIPDAESFEDTSHIQANLNFTPQTIDNTIKDNTPQGGTSLSNGKDDPLISEVVKMRSYPRFNILPPFPHKIIIK